MIGFNPFIARPQILVSINVQANSVVIVAEEYKGLIARILSLFGIRITDQSFLEVKPGGFSLTINGLFYRSRTSGCLANVATTYLRVSRLWPALYAGIMLLLIAVGAIFYGLARLIAGGEGFQNNVGGFALGLFWGVISGGLGLWLIHLYRTTRHVSIGILTSGSNMETLFVFTRSDDHTKFDEAIGVMEKMIQNVQSGGMALGSLDHDPPASPGGIPSGSGSAGGFDLGSGAGVAPTPSSGFVEGPPPVPDGNSTSCPFCAAQIRITPEHVGKNARCPKCKQVFTVKA
jgi:predicted Zn finger-like uncharacterized protein